MLNLGTLGDYSALLVRHLFYLLPISHTSILLYELSGNSLSKLIIKRLSRLISGLLLLIGSQGLDVLIWKGTFPLVSDGLALLILRLRRMPIRNRGFELVIGSLSLQIRNGSERFISSRFYPHTWRRIVQMSLRWVFEDASIGFNGKLVLFPRVLSLIIPNIVIIMHLSQWLLSSLVNPLSLPYFTLPLIPLLPIIILGSLIADWDLLASPLLSNPYTMDFGLSDLSYCLSLCLCHVNFRESIISDIRRTSLNPVLVLIITVHYWVMEVLLLHHVVGLLFDLIRLIPDAFLVVCGNLWLPPLI